MGEINLANYHLEAKLIQRSKGMSIVDRIAYITAQKLVDSYTGRIYDRRSHQGLVADVEVALPTEAPDGYKDIQLLLDALNASEKRKDAQMARSYILSLPVELPRDQQLDLAREFVNVHFIQSGQCAVWALHENMPNRWRCCGDLPPIDKIRENPHLHLVVPFRAVGKDGFQPTKVASRATNRPGYLISLRQDWADCQNDAFSRLGIPIKVSHESLAKQGIHRQATISLGAAVLALEEKGIRTRRGDQYRTILKQNQEKARWWGRAPSHGYTLER